MALDYWNLVASERGRRTALLTTCVFYILCAVLLLDYDLSNSALDNTLRLKFQLAEHSGTKKSTSIW